LEKESIGVVDLDLELWHQGNVVFPKIKTAEFIIWSAMAGCILPLLELRRFITEALYGILIFRFFHLNIFPVFVRKNPLCLHTD
jgi:hypothetical protein